jgi:hypoxanthine phosphoribosyltransferase
LPNIGWADGQFVRVVMAERPYDYSTRRGVLPISWEDFHGICKALARAGAAWQSDLVLAVGRGGYYAGTLVAHLLRIDVQPVRVSRRVDDVVLYQEPRWVLDPPSTLGGRRVLIVDEICSSGKTLTMAKERVEALGARQVKTAVLYAHTWGVSIPDAIGLITDALVLNPWDREILRDGIFQVHPEVVEALGLQGRTPDPSLLIATPTITLAKGP